MPITRSALALIAMTVASTACLAGEPSRHVVYGRDVAAVSTTAWLKDGTLQSVAGSSAEAIPKSAVRYTVKTVKWPSATVRILAFTKAGGGVLYGITDESSLLVLQGSVKVTIGDNSAALRAGDVAAGVSGILRTADDDERTVVVAWTAKPVRPEAPSQSIVRAEAAKPAGDPETAIGIKTYAFSGNSIRYADMAPNSHAGGATGALDNYHYIVEGHVRFREDGETFDVHGGDFLYQEARSDHEWSTVDRTKVVATSAPSP